MPGRSSSCSSSIAKELDVPCARASGYVDGADGGLALADVVSQALASAPANPEPRYLYDLADPLVTKIEKVAKTVYASSSMEPPQAQKDAQKIEATSLSHAPICMARPTSRCPTTRSSVGVPRRTCCQIQSIRLSSGAGFVVPLCGDIMTMPGLGREPAVLGMTLGDDGTIEGLK